MCTQNLMCLHGSSPLIDKWLRYPAFANPSSSSMTENSTKPSKEKPNIDHTMILQDHSILIQFKSIKFSLFS